MHMLMYEDPKYDDTQIDDIHLVDAGIDLYK